jgi:hypothetical protein
MNKSINSRQMKPMSSTKDRPATDNRAPTEKRSRQVALRVTPQEYQLIHARAQSLQTSVTNFLVSMSCSFSNAQLLQLWKHAARNNPK